MPETSYIIAAVAIGAVITVILRALPFALLKPLRNSPLVQRLGRWMPVGIMLILAVVVIFGEVQAHPGRIIAVFASCTVTVAVHLLCNRRAILSIVAGTGCYIWLVNYVM